MKLTALHIIAFDVPYPANYGGVIDVYHKVRWLKKEGIRVILHCFEYGRGTQAALLQVADEVYYYPRSKSFIHQFSSLPFIVKTRLNQTLTERLLADDYPILMEGLHSTGILLDKRFHKRITIFRESNIEHDYYNGLAIVERNWLKRIYYKIEAIKLKKYEKIIHYAQLHLIVSEEETNYFKRNYPTNKVAYLPSFHGNDIVNIEENQEDEKYILFHGNLSVQENINALYQLINRGVFDLPYQFVVAGLNPDKQLVEKISTYKNIELIASPNAVQMEQLIRRAHLHLLYTDQATGLKLKLINVLYTGKFILANSNMLVGTGDLTQLVDVADDKDSYLNQIHTIMHKDFSIETIQYRKKVLGKFDNVTKTIKLIELISELE